MDVRNTLDSEERCNGFDSGNACPTPGKSSIEFSFSELARRTHGARSTRTKRVNGHAAAHRPVDTQGGRQVFETDAALAPSVLRIAARRASARAGKPGVAVHTKDLQLAAALLAQTKLLPAVRQAVVDRALERDEAGFYDQNRIVEKTLDRLHADLAE